MHTLALFFTRNISLKLWVDAGLFDRVGSWSAVIAKWLYKKPLIVRTGYTASLFIQQQSKSRLKRKLYEWMERFAYRNADIGVVASHKDKQYICSMYQISEEKINVLSNYIDTAVFRPIDCEKYADRVVFVGRLNPQKNLFRLLEAVSETGFTLDIYGEGELHGKLEHRAKELNIQLKSLIAIDIIFCLLYMKGCRKRCWKQWRAVWYVLAQM